MDPSLRERFARPGPIRGIDRVPPGSPVRFVLDLPPGRMPETIDGMFALTRRGLTMPRAKRTIEALVETSSVFVDLSTVEDSHARMAELAGAGIASARVLSVEPASAPGPVEEPVTPVPSFR